MYNKVLFFLIFPSLLQSWTTCNYRESIASVRDPIPISFHRVCCWLKWKKKKAESWSHCISIGNSPVTDERKASEMFFFFFFTARYTFSSSLRKQRDSHAPGNIHKTVLLIPHCLCTRKPPLLLSSNSLYLSCTCFFHRLGVTRE